MFMARRIFVVLLSFFVMTACRRGGGDNKGELVGVGGKSWKQPTPYGMTLIPSGSFIMGSSDDDKTASLKRSSQNCECWFVYMDETEITNSEYRQFVNWVRDSIIRTQLADMAEQTGQTSGGGGIGDFAYLDTNTEKMNAYQQYLQNTYGDQKARKLNKKKALIWGYK